MPHRIAHLIYALLLLSVFSDFSQAGQASESEVKKSQIEQIETELSREKEQLMKFDDKERSLLGQLSELEKKIDEKKQFLKKIRKKISSNKKELSIGRDKIEELEESLGAVSESLGKRLIAFYKYAKRGYVKLLASSKDLTELRKRIRYLMVIMDEDRQLLEEMATVEQKYQKEMSLVKERLAVITRMERAEINQLSSIKKDLDSKVIFLMKIHKEKEFYETAVKELQLAAQNLKEKLLGLEKDLKKSRLLPDDFRKQKGRLPLPCNGKVVRSNNPLGAGNVDTHRGIYIKGAQAAEVKAVSPGRVDFSGWLKGYGQVIVVNHGSRFFTISAHLSERFKEDGDMVDKGAVIGLLGDTGSLGEPRLYFEIRRGGTNLDPAKWLKVD